MPTTFANSIDNNPIYATRAEQDKDGNRIDTTYAKSSSLATVATSGSYNDLSNKPTIPTVDQSYNASSTNAQSGTAVAGAIATVKQVPASTSSDANKVLTVNSSGNPIWSNVELFEAVYGTTTYAEVASAVAAKKIVYCRISPNASRMAVLSYIGSSNFEFRYPVSINDKSYSSQVDKVAVYNLTADGWTNTPKNTGTRVLAGTNMSYSYSGETLTLNADAQLPASTSSDEGKVLTVNSSGNPEWQAGGGGSSTYKFLQINDEPGTHDDDVGTFVNANIGTGPIVVRFKYSYDSGFSYYEEDYVVQYCLDKMDSNNPYPYFTLVGATNNNGNMQVYTYYPEVSGSDVSYTSSLKTVKAEYSGATIVDYDTYSYTPYDNLFNYFQASGENSAKNLFINVNASSMSTADKAALFGSDYSSYSALILTNGYALLDSNSDLYGVKFCGIFNNYDNSAKYLVTASFIYNGQIIPTKTLTVEAITSGGSTELFEAVYGTTTYADVQAAVRSKKIVYCRISASDPTRMAFLAYIGTNNFEFQYYRSLSSHNYTNQVDEVYVYKVDSTGWTTTTRTTGPRVVAGTNMNYTYSSGTLTLNAPASGNMLSVTNNIMNVTTTAGITDIQKVSALPANPVSTVLYLIEE